MSKTTRSITDICDDLAYSAIDKQDRYHGIAMSLAQHLITAVEEAALNGYDRELAAAEFMVAAADLISEPNETWAAREYKDAVASKADRWVPACGGSETPVVRNGRRYLYCFNPARCSHAYLDLSNDTLVEDLPDNTSRPTPVDWRSNNPDELISG